MPYCHVLQIAISKQEDGLKALENAKDIQNKFDKKGKDIQNRLFDIISREENIVRVGVNFQNNVIPLQIRLYHCCKNKNN